MRKALIALLGVCLTTGISATFADSDPDNLIKYRKHVMGAVGSHTNALVAILKGEVPHSDALKTHAEGLVLATNPAVVLAAFETNTDGQGSEKTTATAKIWEDWARYEQAVNELNAAAVQIQVAAANNTLTSFDQLKPALSQCGYCHRESGFREK